MLLNVEIFRISPSNIIIVKPPAPKKNSADVEAIDDAMQRVKEAQKLISKALEPEKYKEREGN